MLWIRERKKVDVCVCLNIKNYRVRRRDRAGHITYTYDILEMRVRAGGKLLRFVLLLYSTCIKSYETIQIERTLTKFPVRMEE